MGQERKQMDEEIESIRRARNNLDEQLVNKMEIRAVRIHEDETKTKMKKEKHTETSPRREESSDETRTRSPSATSRSTSRRGRRGPEHAPREVHWSGTKGKGKKGKGGKGKGDPRDGREDPQRRERAEANYSSAAGGRSNKQRLHILESDQAENLANDERMRTDIDNNAKKMTREMEKMTRTMEKMQGRLTKLEERERNKKSRSNKDRLMSNHVQGGDRGAQDRQGHRVNDADSSRRRSN